jgi:hypothetical protein
VRSVQQPDADIDPREGEPSGARASVSPFAVVGGIMEKMGKHDQ